MPWKSDLESFGRAWSNEFIENKPGSDILDTKGNRHVNTGKEQSNLEQKRTSP